MKYSEFNNDWSDMELQYLEGEIFVYCDGVMIGKVSKEYRYMMSTHYAGFEELPLPVAVKLFADMAMLAQTPLAEREEEKLYNIIFPTIQRDGNFIYMAKDNSNGDPLSVDWSDSIYMKRNPTKFAFTEQEIKAIDERYLAFKVEVTPE